MATPSMYNHRVLGTPAHPAQAPSKQSTVIIRLNDSFDNIRREFDGLASEVDAVRNQRDEFEAKMIAQLGELEAVRRSLFELEGQHAKIRQQYEDEINILRSEVSALRQSGRPPPGPLGIPGLRSTTTSEMASPSRESHDSLDKAREREHNTVTDRELLERRAESNDSDRARDGDRLVDQRDSKRAKYRRDRPDQSQLPTPKLLSSNALPLPNIVPCGNNVVPNDARKESGPLPSISMNHKAGRTNDLSIDRAPPEFRKEGPDWFAIFNPSVRRVLDISLLHTFTHESVVCCVQFSLDGRYLASGCNRTTQIYDTKSGAKVCVLMDESAGQTGDLYIRSVRFSPDGKLLATGAEDRQIRIWDIAKRRVICTFDGHQQEIYSLDFSRDGRFVVSGSGDRTARIWDMMDKSCKVLTINDADSLNNDSGVTSVAISPDGNYVAAGSLDSVVRIWEVTTGTLLERLRGHKDSVYSVAFTADGKGLLSGSLDMTLKYWDISDLARGKKGKKELVNTSYSSGAVAKREGAVQPSCLKDFVGHKDYVLSVAISHDSQWVVSGSKDRCVHFWDAHDASLQFILQGHKNSVISLDLNPLGNMFATGSGDNLARIWSYNNV